MSPWPFVEPLPTRVMATAKVLGPKYVVSATCGRGGSSRWRLPRVERSAGLSECEQCAACLAELSLVSSVRIGSLWVKSNRNPTWINLLQRGSFSSNRVTEKAVIWMASDAWIQEHQNHQVSGSLPSPHLSFSFCHPVIPEEEVLSWQHYSSWISGKDSDWLQLGAEIFRGMITLAREGRLGYITGPAWLSGLGESKWLGSSEDLIKLYGWDGEGQDRVTCVGTIT